MAQKLRIVKNMFSEPVRRVFQVKKMIFSDSDTVLQKRTVTDCFGFRADPEKPNSFYLKEIVSE